MTLQVKNFYYPVPYRLALKHLFDGYAFNMRSLCAVQVPNHISHFFYVVHVHIPVRDLFKSQGLLALIEFIDRLSSSP